MNTKQIIDKLGLATFDRIPSWCKRTGAVDRSACVELKAREVRWMARCVPRMITKKGDVRRNGHAKVQPLPNEQPAYTASGRESTGVWTITGWHLERLQRARLPRRLGGDWRTPRAHAMRPVDWTPYTGHLDVCGNLTEHQRRKRGKGFRTRFTRQRRELPYLDFGLDGNPNRGASRQKTLGIAPMWSQPIRVEKWRRAATCATRWQYWLICPGCTPLVGEGSPPRLPQLSTRPPGHLHDREAGQLQRVLFLYMPLATSAEVYDAQVAWRWITGLTATQRQRHAATIEALAQRYGVLFPPRTMVCRRCLGIRYGTDPNTALRQTRRAAAMKQHGSGEHRKRRARRGKGRPDSTCVMPWEARLAAIASMADEEDESPVDMSSRG